MEEVWGRLVRNRRTRPLLLLLLTRTKPESSYTASVDHLFDVGVLKVLPSWKIVPYFGILHRMVHWRLETLSRRIETHIRIRSLRMIHLLISRGKRKPVR